MKNVKILVLGLLLTFAFSACKDDDLGNLLPPGADFNFTPAAPIEGQEILFYADPAEGSGEIVEWKWNFNDGKGSTSNKRNPYFTFETAGTYNVTLVVRNPGGASFEVTKPVEVSPPPKEFIASIVWEVNNETAITNNNEGSNSPAIADDGTIYYVEGNAGVNSKLVAVTDNGATAQVKWATTMAQQVSNAPSIGPDGHIYLNTWLGTRSIAKMNAADGAIMWSGGVGTGVSNNTPAVDAQGNTYHGTRSQTISGVTYGGAFSWSPTGEKRWEITNVGAFYAAPVISKDGNTVYFLNTNEGKLWAVNAATGAPKWTESVGMGSGTHGSSLSMNSDGTIYYTTNAHIVAITDNGATGSVKWSTAMTGAAQSGVVIGPNGDLYTGAGAGLVALDPADGTVKWTHNMATIESVPAVDVSGNIYLGSSDGKLIVVNPEGQLLKEFELGTGAVNSPTITSNGTVYVEARSGTNIKLFKIAVEESGPANSPWPMKGQNVKNTGHAK